jgi:hypothetical protein
MASIRRILNFPTSRMRVEYQKMNSVAALIGLVEPELWSFSASVVLIFLWMVSHRLGRPLRLLLRRAGNRHRVVRMRAQAGVLPPVNRSMSSSDPGGRADVLAGMRAVSRVSVGPTAARPGRGYRRPAAVDADGGR